MSEAYQSQLSKIMLLYASSILTISIKHHSGVLVMYQCQIDKRKKLIIILLFLGIAALQVSHLTEFPQSETQHASCEIWEP